MKIKKAKKPSALAAIAAISVFAFILLYLNYVTDGPIIQADTWLRDQLYNQTEPALYGAMAILTHLGGALFIAIASTILTGIMIAQGKNKLAFIWISTLLGGQALIFALKAIIQRARPEHLLDVSSYSFPSGHAAGATMFFCLLFYTYNKHIPRKKTFMAACAVMFILVGATRIYLSVHWLTDVLAGFALGLFWTSTCILAVTHIKK